MYSFEFRVQAWADTPSMGLASFGPNQFRLLGALDHGLGDCVYFLGDYLTVVHHGWMVGSFNSAVIAVRKVLVNVLKHKYPGDDK